MAYPAPSWLCRLTLTLAISEKDGNATGLTFVMTTNVSLPRPSMSLELLHSLVNIMRCRVWMRDCLWRPLSAKRNLAFR